MVSRDMQEALRDDFEVGDPVGVIGMGVAYYWGASGYEFSSCCSEGGYLGEIR